MSRLLLLPLAVVAAGLPSPALSPVPQPAVQDPTMPIQHTLKKFDDAAFVTAGEIRFDDAGVPTLTVLAPGPMGDDLRVAWADLTARDALLWRREEQTPEGREVSSLRVRRGSADYPLALLDQLSAEFGFFATP